MPLAALVYAPITGDPAPARHNPERGIMTELIESSVRLKLMGSKNACGGGTRMKSPATS